jgi:hypothetical protein
MGSDFLVQGIALHILLDFLFDELTLELVLLVIDIFVLNLGLDSLMEKIVLMEGLLLYHGHTLLGLVQSLHHGAAQLL